MAHFCRAAHPRDLLLLGRAWSPPGALRAAAVRARPPEPLFPQPPSVADGRPPSRSRRSPPPLPQTRTTQHPPPPPLVRSASSDVVCEIYQLRERARARIRVFLQDQKRGEKAPPEKQKKNQRARCSVVFEKRSHTSSFLPHPFHRRIPRHIKTTLGLNTAHRDGLRCWLLFFVVDGARKQAGPPPSGLPPRITPRRRPAPRGRWPARAPETPPARPARWPPCPPTP